MDCSPPGFSVHGILRQEWWNGLPFPSPGDLPDQGIKPGSPALQAESLPSEPTGKWLIQFAVWRALTVFTLLCLSELLLLLLCALWCSHGLIFLFGNSDQVFYFRLNSAVPAPSRISAHSFASLPEQPQLCLQAVTCTPVCAAYLCFTNFI